MAPDFDHLEQAAGTQRAAAGSAAGGQRRAAAEQRFEARVYENCPGAGLSGSFRRGGYLLSHFRSTIGVVRFNFSVRNGKRWSPHAIAALVSFYVFTL